MRIEQEIRARRNELYHTAVKERMSCDALTKAMANFTLIACDQLNWVLGEDHDGQSLHDMVNQMELDVAFGDQARPVCFPEART